MSLYEHDCIGECMRIRVRKMWRQYTATNLTRCLVKINCQKNFCFLFKVFIIKLVNYVNRDEVQKLRATKRVKEIKLINFSSIVHSKKLTYYILEI